MSAIFLRRKGIFLFTTFLLILFFSCKKDGKLSPDFDNGNLTIIFVDTFSIKSTVKEDDSLQTDLIPYQLLGVYHDPIFGVKSSSIYTNVGLNGVTNFPRNFNVDSLVLSLAFTNFYGNPSSSITVEVFELAAVLSASNDYFSNTYTTVENTLLGTTNYTPGTSDSTLRVVITNSQLLNAIKNDTSYANTSEFNDVLKGFYIVTSDTAGGTPALTVGAGALATFNLNSSLSKVTIHYNDSLNDDLIINSDVKSYARYINYYVGTDIEKHLSNDPSKNINRIYVSDMEGVRTKIEIPYLKNLANEGAIAINKAEITFTLENGTDATPDDVLKAITLAGIDSEDEVFDLVDSKERASHFGGVYDTTTETIKFNITRHVQQIINNKITAYGMYLMPNPAIVIPNRAIFNSENSPTFKAKLEITYSKF